MKLLNTTYLIISAMALMTIMPSCKKNFLDVVPDNVPTVDNAFANRYEAEKYLFTCYSYLPQDGHHELNPGMHTGDEFWIYFPLYQPTSTDPYNIARGNQNKVAPLMNYWDGFDGKSMWQGIRNCNIFLENVDKVIDLQSYEKARWVAEVKFLKAYYHWYLFRMYGPIPIIDKNLPISASPADVRVSRQPVDSVVNYIANLLDEAATGENGEGLPNQIMNATTELGRITKPAALAIKARLLVTAASPLFNGNNDFASLKNKDGKALLNTTYDAKKWERAAAACKTAIDAAEASGAVLYTFNPSQYIISPAPTPANIQEMSIRNAVCEKWNKELIFGPTAVTNAMQYASCTSFDPANLNISLNGHLAPTFKMAELFYTKNGVPIEEDKTWDYANRYNIKVTTSVGTDTLMQNNYKTIGLHLNREARFYADLGFDGIKWYMRNGTFNLKSKGAETGGKQQSLGYSVTGYYAKKLTHWSMVYNTSSITVESYPWPIMRLGDLYLLYAEAANEAGDGPTALIYLNRIRTRAGLQSVESSWTNYSNNPTKFTTQTGLRAIIHQERGIEMAFEGSRFWDLKRWKEAGTKLNEPIFGWDVSQKTAEDYYRKLLVYNPTFVSPRDYFWPMKENNLLVNPNLVQNVGW